MPTNKIRLMGANSNCSVNAVNSLSSCQQRGSLFLIHISMTTEGFSSFLFQIWCMAMTFVSLPTHEFPTDSRPGGSLLFWPFPFLSVSGHFLLDCHSASPSTTTLPHHSLPFARQLLFYLTSGDWKALMLRPHLPPPGLLLLGRCQSRPPSSSLRCGCNLSPYRVIVAGEIQMMWSQFLNLISPAGTGVEVVKFPLLSLSPPLLRRLSLLPSIPPFPFPVPFLFPFPLPFSLFLPSSPLL